MNKKLFRLQQGSMLGGVCSGVGDYLRIDPLFIRVFFRPLGGNRRQRRIGLFDFMGGHSF